MSEAKVATRRVQPDAAGIAEAARLLAEGHLVAFPTETVYGLGADATDARAVARLFAAKGRPSFNPLIAHVADVMAARRAGKLSPLAEKLVQFWPGPLTLVVPARDVVCELARAGLATVALRVPKHPVAQALLAAFGKPIAAPSANRSGHVSPTTADHVLADLEGFVDLVVDGGPTPLGLESTIVDVSGDTPRLLRTGGVPRADIERALGMKLAAAGDKVRAPGMLASHYATRARLRLDAQDVRPGEALLAFGAPRPAGAEGAAHVLDLSPRGDLVEAAANLFAHLRALDATGAAAIAVAPIPAHGLGEAINDRLGRAAAPR
ncbi:MAG TPA: L-threonylcarbamoyladenylate synthase [Xanthobacteraceae bacterium]|nr:L-threonylcarbamoyladenylate synthase [Xanthobacteraceae bacterium]